MHNFNLERPQSASGHSRELKESLRSHPGNMVEGHQNKAQTSLYRCIIISSQNPIEQGILDKSMYGD